MIDVTDLIGIRYKTNGRTKTGYDCLGLAIEVGRRFGYEIPCGEHGVGNFPDSFKRVDNISEGDVILFFDASGRNRHIGVALSQTDIIHCDIFGVRVSKLSEFDKLHYEVYSWL